MIWLGWITAAIAIAWATAAPAQTCAPHTQVAERLARNYDEKPIAIGLETRGTLMTLWANMGVGTWTLTKTNPDGTACIIAVGNNIEAIRPKKKGEKG